jgi:hypothetical protein
MAAPANPTATTASCPQCEGYGVERSLGRQGANAVILTTTCGLCGGTGRLPTVAVNAPAPPAAAPAPPPLSLVPFLIPLVLFILFFLFLWL